MKTTTKVLDQRDPAQCLYVGMDIHKDTHTAVATNAFGQRLLTKEIANSETDFADLVIRVKQLADHHQLIPIFGLEDSQGYGRRLAKYLVDQQLPVKAVAPVLVDQMRSGETHPEKSDQLDAKGVAEVLIQRIDRLPSVSITEVSSLAKDMKELAGDRAFLVTESTRLKNQLHWLLHQAYNTGYREKFKKTFSVKALKYWHRCPVPTSLKHQTLLATRIRRKVKRLQQIRQEVSELENDLAQLVEQSDQHLETMSGCGVVLAATVLGEVRDITRFTSPSALAKYAGLAPREYSSGKRTRHRKSRAGNRPLNRAIHRIALSQISRSGNEYAKAYYQRKIDGGKTKMQAICCLKRRLVNVIYTMLKNHETYDYSRLKTGDSEPV